VIAQRPKLAGYREQMRENIAETLKIDVSQVSVKATTEEGLGFTGTGEGISSQAIALLYEFRDAESPIANMGCGGCCAAK
jgi:2-C-methyl-D-erythritol 2,4-cyclodiphosphate synthase